MVTVIEQCELRFFVREDDLGMKKYPPRNCPIELRLNTWQRDEITLAVVLLRLAKRDIATFEYWIDPASAAGRETPNTIAEQKYIHVYLVTSVIARTLRTPNALASSARRVLGSIRQVDFWTPAQYDRSAAPWTGASPPLPLCGTVAATCADRSPAGRRSFARIATHAIPALAQSAAPITSNIEFDLRNRARQVIVWFARP